MSGIFLNHELSAKQLNAARAMARAKGMTLEKFLTKQAAKVVKKLLGDSDDLTAKEAAVELNLSTFTMRRYYRDGAFPSAYSPNGRDIRIPLAEINRFRDSRRVAVATNNN